MADATVSGARQAGRMSGEHSTPAPAGFVLVGGYWIGPWAWQQVRRRLQALGHRVEVPVLPGLGDGTPPERVTAADQAEAILASLRRLTDPVLVVHSGAGALASLVTDRDSEAVARVVYVDSGPVSDGHVPVPGRDGSEPLPVPTVEELSAMGPLTSDLTPAQLAEFVAEGLPQPGSVVTTPVNLRNPQRLDVPSTVVCCGFSSEQVQEFARGGDPMFAPTLDLHHLDHVDLPGGHWPMLAQPDALANCLHQLVSPGVRLQ